MVKDEIKKEKVKQRPFWSKTATLVENFIPVPHFGSSLKFSPRNAPVLHEKYICEDLFEEDKTRGSDESSEVPMEIVEDE